MQNLSAVILSIFVIISMCVPRDFWLFVIVFRLFYCYYGEKNVLKEVTE
jgi:hypothetical protein